MENDGERNFLQLCGLTEQPSHMSLTLFPSLWHGVYHPNRFSEATSEASRDSRDTQRRPPGDC